MTIIEEKMASIDIFYNLTINGQNDNNAKFSTDVQASLLD